MSLKYLSARLSKVVFRDAAVEIHMCDEKLDTIRLILPQQYR